MITTTRALGTGLLTGMLALLPVASAQAATATTTVEISFPQILILYTFDQIDLSVDAAGLADAITPGTTTCAGDYCSDQGTVDLTGTGLALDGSDTLDADIAGGVGSLPGPVTVTVENAFGVRALGHSSYTAGVAAAGTPNAAFGSPAVTTPNYTGLQLSTGDLSFTIDLSQLSGGATESQDYQITVTGN